MRCLGSPCSGADTSLASQFKVWFPMRLRWHLAELLAPPCRVRAFTKFQQWFWTHGRGIAEALLMHVLMPARGMA